MAWLIVGVSTSVEVTATGHTLTVPAGVAAGDLLVACISSRIASTTSITLPTGGEWTLVGEQKANNVLTTSSALPSAMMAYCVRGASNPNLTFTHPTAPSVAIGHIVAYRGNAAVSPRDGAAAAATTAINITAVSLAGLTTTVADDLIIALAAGGQEATWTSFNATSPSGASGTTDTTTAPSATWRKRAEIITTTGGDTSLGIFDAVKTAAGATGNFTVTASIAAGHSIVAGAFKIGVAVSTSVSGQAVIASVGAASVTAIQNVSTSVSGQIIAASIGNVSVIAIVPPTDRQYSLGGPLGASFVSETASRSYALSSGYIAETITPPGPSPNINVTVTGQQVAASVGIASVTTAGNVTVSVTGQSVTASVGTADVIAKQNITTGITGQSVTAAVGTATVDAAIAGGPSRQYFIGSPLGATYVSETGSNSYALPAGYVTETAVASPNVVVSVAGQAVNVSCGSVTVTAAATGLISVWTGSAWVDKPMMVWTGSAWAQKPVKHWNGSTWL